ncbi:hypothetical protein CTEN210_16297 [Chaetoceros tenuissimus]|uniref:Uncharacterized protein n=1 Tax=Chaetoceros tenuissimus TaxID=426638 RepID=A0AAD3HE12_9STRA|nr:hypothetical protein CTEN210_16297 [Chaetoceros tenuissimus]
MSYWCQRPQDPTGQTVLQLVTNIKYLSWEAVEDRLAKFPRDAAEKDRFGLTSLHHVIRKRHCQVPLHIIKYLIQADTSVLKLSDSQTGRNALHIACIDHSSDEVNGYPIIQMILDAYPEGARHIDKEGRIPLHKVQSIPIARELIKVYPDGLGIRSSFGRLPLHDAVSDNSIPPEVVEELIVQGRAQKIGTQCGDGNYCGGVLVKDGVGEMPIKILFRRLLFSSKSTKDGLVIDSDSPLWTKLCIIARASYLAINEFPKDWKSKEIPLLHTLVEFGGHVDIIQHALDLYPHEILMRDSKGRTPLCIASETVDNGDHTGIKTREGVIDVLLDARRSGKEAAKMVNHEQRLPLHVAVEKGRSWHNGVETIVNAEPMALQTRDMQTGLYPFQLAAIQSFNWDNADINTVYSLLYANPDVMRSIADD